MDVVQHLLATHPLAFTAFTLVPINLMWLTARSVISKCRPSPLVSFLKGLPVLKLGLPVEANTPAEIGIFWGFFFAVSCFYTSVWNWEGRQRARENPVWIVENRFEILIVGLALQTALYEFSKRFVVYTLPIDQRPAQAANVVRVSLKLSLLAYTAACGNWYKILVTSPAELDEKDFEPAYWGPFGMIMLYTWELLFRDLKPVNFIHHGASLIAAWSVVEWYADNAAGNSVRKIIPVGTVMSFAEGFCCLGTVCYRFASRKVAAKVMLADAIFVIIVYNIVALCYIGTLYKNWETFDSNSHVSCPLILCLTYPAQMNMVRIFMALHKKAVKAHREEVKAALAKKSEEREEKREITPVTKKDTVEAQPTEEPTAEPTAEPIAEPEPVPVEQATTKQESSDKQPARTSPRRMALQLVELATQFGVDWTNRKQKTSATQKRKVPASEGMWAAKLFRSTAQRYGLRLR